MLEVRDLRKRYGATRALDGLDLVARPGELLGIAGPNGAGKSTLVRVLAGETIPDVGTIELDGRPWSAQRDSRSVAVVHQEPQLFPNLSLADNLAIERERHGLGRPRPRQNELAVLKRLDIAEFANHRLGALPLAIQQRAEIARALVRDARLFLFDEPNSALTDEESTELFAQMRALVAAERIVVLVSHRLAELVAEATRIAVVRDGRCAKVLEGPALTQEVLARELVVEHRAQITRRRAAAVSSPSSDAVLSVQDWRHSGGVFDVEAFTLRPGEMAAIVGVEGSGAREFVASLAGYEEAAGELSVGGASGRRSRDRIAYIPASRRSSLFPNLTVEQNLVVRLGVDEIAGRSHLLRRRRMRHIASRAREEYGVRCSSLQQPVHALSGGNQQKIAISAAMARRPLVLVSEEPTRGVDVGSKADIYQLLEKFVADGHAVLMYCTEVPEIFEAAHAVRVMDRGRLSAPLDVTGYKTLRELAADIAALERHADLEQHALANHGARGDDGE